MTTAVSAEYNALGKTLPPGLMDEVLLHIGKVEKQMGQTFGSSSSPPLLVAVRAGASVSMPGMLDTVLNIGLNDEVTEALAAATNVRFAYDSYRRLLSMFGEVVLGMEAAGFESELEAVREEMGVDDDSFLTGEHMQEVVRRFKNLYATQVLGLGSKV